MGVPHLGFFMDPVLRSHSTALTPLELECLVPADTTYLASSCQYQRQLCCLEDPGSHLPVPCGCLRPGANLSKWIKALNWGKMMATSNPKRLKLEGAKGKQNVLPASPRSCAGIFTCMSSKRYAIHLVLYSAQWLPEIRKPTSQSGQDVLQAA